MLQVPNVDLGSDTDLFRELVNTWWNKRPRNITRSVYYDGEQALKDFGISLPPQMTGVKAALGWTAKGVHAVTDRSRFEGFVDSSGVTDPFDLEQVMWENRFQVELPAAQVSSAIHGCSFLTVTPGDAAAGEPTVLVMARAADVSAGVWDARRRRLKGFLSVTDVDDDGQASELIMYTDVMLYTISKARTVWDGDARAHLWGRVPAVPLVHKFELRRPLGHSRITRASMYYNDAALRTIVRAEVSSEFFSAPEYWVFGPDASQFALDRWTAVMGRVKALDVPDGDDKPDLHRFTGASPQPHTEMLRMWANLFADDQDLDVKFADSSNPSSADAIFAAKETLITTTRDANALWGFGAVQAMQLAVQIRDNLDMLPDEVRSLRANYTDPAIVSPSARADAYSKIAASDPDFASSRVGRQYAGLSLEQIDQLEAEQRRNAASSRIADLVEAAKGIRASNDPPGDDELTAANVLKAKADALGVLRRAGVTADDAARMAGLDGVKFIPGQPITIKTAEE